MWMKVGRPIAIPYSIKSAACGTSALCTLPKLHTVSQRIA